MKGAQLLPSVRKIYDIVHAALWALLAAFVVVFVVFYAPYMPAALRASEARQTLLDEQEFSDLCAKWGLILQTREHTACTMDMRQFRSRIEEQLIARFHGVF